LGKLWIWSFLLMFPFKSTHADDVDAKQKVMLPDIVKRHMLDAMHDNLLAVHEIQAALDSGDLNKAGDIAETRFGMTSLASHNAAHIASLMPPAMRQIGIEMHVAASRFVASAKEGDMVHAMDSFAAINQQCAACHAAYRLD
jgi:hypothetical protein